MIPRILFLLKRRESYWGVDPGYSQSLSSGLTNSVRFVVDMLNRHGVSAVAEQVADNNAIDRAVAQHRPTHVVVEAFWVVPEKFDVLRRLHPTVRWIVRNHSEIPFLANEGMAIGWARDYMRRGVEVMSNAPRAVSAMRAIAAANNLPETLATFGPNVYPEPAAADIRPHIDYDASHVDIACFGAIRPLKNHLQQAIAGIQFGDAIGKPIRFHINATRVEGNAGPILRNLRALFDEAHGHELVEHAWLPHDEFVAALAGMAMAMQVSYSETFNIVTADAMAASVPIIASRDVPWIGDYAHVDPNSPEHIAGLAMRIWEEGPTASARRLHQQRHDLINYCRTAESTWLQRFQPRGDVLRPAWPLQQI